MREGQHPNVGRMHQDKLILLLKLGMNVIGAQDAQPTQGQIALNKKARLPVSTSLVPT